MMAATSGSNAGGDPPAVLVVEDNYLTASTVCDVVRDCGFVLAGCVPRLEPGLELLAKREVDAAIVDINLDGTFSYPLCAELRRRSVPFWFLTAYRTADLPPLYRGVPLISKPADTATIRAALASLRPQTPAECVPIVLPTNLLLQQLDEDDRQALEACLERRPLRPGELLEEPGKPVDFVTFPISGAVSIQAVEAAKTAEVALVGRQGLVGHSVLLGPHPAMHRAEVLFAGEAWRAPAAAIASLTAMRPRLRANLLHDVDALMQRMSIRTLTSARGTVEQRVARWLLEASRSLGTNDLDVVHATIATALGVRRAGVTVALHVLEGEGALRSDRGRVRILDSLRLGALADIPRPSEARPMLPLL